MLEWVASISVQGWIMVALALALLRIGLARAPWLGAEAEASAGEFVETLLYWLVVLFLVVRPFFVQFSFIPSGSMLPTIQIGDWVMVNKLIYRFEEPRRGDIIVFKAPPAASATQEEFIKRCVAIPGDTVDLVDGHIRVTNRRGRLVDTGLQSQDPYLLDPNVWYDRFQFDPKNPDETKFTLPPGELWMMGDNRNDSADSHVWGPLDRSRVLGKATFRYWPPRRIGWMH